MTLDNFSWDMGGYSSRYALPENIAQRDVDVNADLKL